MANWAKIKIAYLNGEKPLALGKKHKVKAKTISERASKENWKQERTNLDKEIEDNFKSEIKELISLALPELKKIIETETLKVNADGTRTEVKTADKINAIKAVLDISGLKREKTEIGGTIDLGSIAEKKAFLEKLAKKTSD